MSIYLIEPKQSATSSFIYEFHRNEDGTDDIKVIRDFKPYFFVDEDCPLENFDGVIRTEKGFTSIDKTPIKKVYTQHSRINKSLRYKVEGMGYNHWEGDILYHNRYTIDLKDDIEEGPLKVCWLDIETAPEDTFRPGKNLDTQKFPDIETADQAICCLTIKIDGIMTTWLCGPNDFEGTRYFKNEEDMLEDFLNFFHKESPDIISAWNLKGFDLKYIIRRCQRLGVNIKRLSKTMDVWERKINGEISFKTFGLVQLDLLDGYKLWRKYGNMPLLQSYSLDFVAETVLKKNKLDHGKSMAYLWKNDLKTLIEYNKWDVELLDLIDKQCKVINFFDSIRRKCHIQFEDVYKTTAMIDGFLMNRLNKSIILPTSVYRKNEKFEGAFVFEPIPGLYENVLCQDIASMYPSIIKNFNISYETVGGGEIILPLEHPISFSKKRGIIPMFMDELKEERTNFKKLRNKYPQSDPKYTLYDQRQYGTKIIMNCFSHDTEIMTVNGKKNIKDVKIGDYVYSINPKTKDLETKKVVKTFKYNYSGDMIHINNQNIDLMVTPEHNMLVDKGKFIYAKNFTHNNTIPIHKQLNPTLEADYINLLDYDNKNNYRYYVKKNIDLRIFKKLYRNIEIKKINKKWCEVIHEYDLNNLYLQGYEVFAKHKRDIKCGKFKPYIKPKLFASLVGFYVSEGSLYKTMPKGKRGSTYSINISQYKNINPETYKLIKNTIINLGIKPRCYNKCISFSSDIWYKILKLSGTNAKNKTLKHFIGLPTKELFDSLYLGDGNKNINRYNTSSKQLSEEVAQLIFKLGYRSIITQTKDKCYRVNFQKRCWKPHDNSINIVKNNSNKVYCVEVEDNHTVYAGKNNKMCWTGQSFFGYLGYPGSRLYKKTVAGAITGMGKYIILKIADWCKDKGNTVIYGDTDSVYVLANETEKYKVAIEGMGLAKHIDKKLETLAMKISGKNYLFIEFEKALKRVLFTSAKKRYAYKLLWEDNAKFDVDDKMHLQGFDSKRSDSNIVSKIAQKTVIEMLIDGEEKDKILGFLKDLDTKMREGGFTDEEVGFPKGLQKELEDYNPPSAIIKGAIFSNRNFNTTFGKKTKPKFVYINTYKGKVPQLEVELKKVKDGFLNETFTKTYELKSIAYETVIPEGFDIDWDTMSEKTFKNKLKKIFEAVGWEWEDLNLKEKNSDLNEWFTR